MGKTYYGYASNFQIDSFCMFTKIKTKNYLIPMQPHINELSGKITTFPFFFYLFHVLGTKVSQCA